MSFFQNKQIIFLLLHISKELTNDLEIGVVLKLALFLVTFLLLWMPVISDTVELTGFFFCLTSIAYDSSLNFEYFQHFIDN